MTIKTHSNREAGLNRDFAISNPFGATVRLSHGTILPDEHGMKVKANPRYETFFANLQGLKRPFAKWEGVAFRATPLPHANAVKLLDGKGSFKTGGRWSAAGTFCAVNLSTSQEAAVKESSASFTYYNFAPSDVRPKVVVGVRLRLVKVLDLVDPRGLRMLPRISLEELLTEDWRKVNDAGHEALSQALGRAAHDAGAPAHSKTWRTIEHRGSVLDCGAAPSSLPAKIPTRQMPRDRPRCVSA